jgi:hypothetical protein
MIHWTLLPDELVFSSPQDQPSPIREITINGVPMQVRMENHSLRIVRLLSPDPQHYLDPRFQPGNEISLLPFVF